MDDKSARALLCISKRLPVKMERIVEILVLDKQALNRKYLQHVVTVNRFRCVVPPGEHLPGLRCLHRDGRGRCRRFSSRVAVQQLCHAHLDRESGPMSGGATWPLPPSIEQLARFVVDHVMHGGIFCRILNARGSSLREAEYCETAPV